MPESFGVSLTVEQEDFLNRVVANCMSGVHSEFIFTRSHEGSGLTYAGLIHLGFVPMIDETDLQLLAAAGLITVRRVGPHVYQGKPTPSALAAVRQFRGGGIVQEHEVAAPSAVEERVQEVPTEAGASVVRRAKLSRSVGSPHAVEMVRQYIDQRGLNYEGFGKRVGTTGRTIQEFFRTGTVRRDIFDSIARELGTSTEGLLSGLGPPG